MDYEVIVIGAGPGGYTAAIAAAQRQKRVCIVERAEVGGVCLNEGCIPTKTLIKSVKLTDEIKKADEFGIGGLDASRINVDMEKLQARKKAVITKLTGGVMGLLKLNGVTVIKGTAVFKDPNTIIVDGKEITSEYFILATGSKVFIPPSIVIDGAGDVITSSEALDLVKVPDRLGIIGGGAVGIELAYIFSKLGAAVTVFELTDRILPLADEEVSLLAENHLGKAGITFYTGAGVQAVRDNTVNFVHGGKPLEVSLDKVIMAVGRVPNTDGLNLEALGVDMDRGAVKTDNMLKTNISNIYAVGDINGVSMLAHTASHEGITAVNNICGSPESIDYSRVPTCVFIEPEIACIGLTEAQARKLRSVRVGKFPLAGNGKAMLEGQTEGFVKVILDTATGEILGVHICAPNAAEMIGGISAAMTAEATAAELIRAVYPHPAISESIPEAFMGAYGKAIHWR